MSKFLQFLLVILMAVCTSNVSAQQFSDPGFEDWSGSKFADKEQPKYWNFSNVSQMGIDKNFAHKTTGRSGSALKIQDQFVGVGKIGATSPGYVALGKPWAYVSSITAIDDATAGTYGGIQWKYRPDSMVVWIKRYYDSGADGADGDHVMDEDFNILYYAWSGTSQGTSYKAKNGSCTNIYKSKPEYCIDEESDIRQALNGNECETKTYAKQIAEGWICDRKVYSNWTRIVIPIYYLNDDVPQKCNVILSAGRYPDFRANTGQYAGSTMDVDDISLVYSSKIQKLYINGREWKAFDPNSTEEQIYSLGQGVTTIPDMYAVRGAGSLTNNRKAKVTFPGRRLTDTECKITKGQVDGEPTTITVTSEDGKSSTTYKIKFVSRASNNAKLADLQVNGATVNGFNAYLGSYNVALPYGTTTIPTVTATAQDANAAVTITQANSVTGKATVLVTAADGTTQTYTITFSVAALTDVTLQAIYVDGNLLPGYAATKSNYTISLPLGTSTLPVITWESAYEQGAQKIELLQNSLDQGAQIRVSIPGTSLSKVYKITYKIEASSYSYLAGIQLDGQELNGFAADKFVYTISLPVGTTQLPKITWTAGDQYQTIKLIEGGLDGTTRIEVTAASGATSTYRLNFRLEKSNNNALQAIAMNGENLSTFHADSLAYTIVLPIGTTQMPTITWTVGDQYQTVKQSINQTAMTVRLTVTAGDGTIRLYVIAFEVEKSANAFLKMIYLNGDSLVGFAPEDLDYAIEWKNTTMPVVTVDANAGQSVAIAMPSTYGTARIVVTPQEGAPNTYTIRFNEPDNVQMPAFPMDAFPASKDANLAGLYIDGEPYAAFNANTTSYTYPLAQRTKQVPAVVPVAANAGQTIMVEHGAVDRNTIIRVLAEDGKTQKVYTIAFPVEKSSNTQLLSIELDGVHTGYAFDPRQYTYNIALPYGTTTTPLFHVERAEAEQALVITEAPIGKTSSVEVTAEDGTKKTYTFDFTITPPAIPNELASIVVDGIGALDMNQGPNFTLDFPYGTTELNVSVVKNYEDQVVTILNNGVNEPTTITVKSFNPTEADKVYAITPKVAAYDPAMLLELQVNGASLPNFKPNVYNYVVSVSDIPTVAWKAPNGAEVTDEGNEKEMVLIVENEAYAHTYTITYYYSADLTFDLGFENWVEHKNTAVNKTGKYPKGWYAPINAITKEDKGTYEPQKNTEPDANEKTEGSNGAKLSTVYLTTSADAMPGFLSLSEPTVVIGEWILGIGAVSSASTLTFGAPRTFRNTPDQVQLDYKYKEHKNKANGWRFIYSGNGKKQINYAQAFSTMDKNWHTLTQNIEYEAGYVPSTLDILISAAPSDVLKDYYTNFGTNRCTSTMYFDNLRLNYSSVLNGVTVNGVAAMMNGTNITATIDADSYGEPTLAFAHAVKDQMPVIAWSVENNGVRTATITNYAEDLSSTTYTLTVTRPTSANANCTYTLSGKDLTVVKGSPHQTIAVTTNDTAYVIAVTAENGDKKTYYAAWEKGASQETKVTNVPADNLITGVSTALLKNIETEPVLNYDRDYPLDSVVMKTTPKQYAITVYGTTKDTTYIIDRNASSNALLETMEINKQSVQDFYSETYDYIVSLSSLDEFSATAQDENATVEYTQVKIDDTHTAIFVLVTAADGETTKKYSVLAKVRALATDAYLTSIMTDGTQIAGFASTKYDYTLALPSGSTIPQVSAVACQGAIVEMNSEKQTAGEKVTFVVTSEDGLTSHTYTLTITILPSDICTLENIFVGGVVLDGFAPTKYNYTVELPYGTTQMPEVDYILTDIKSKATKTANGNMVTIVVTAENGVASNTYTLTFTIAKSTNAYLKSIALDGVDMSNFYADQLNYDVLLPYGSSIPTITAVPADTTATMVINGNQIIVTAEDGVTSNTYTLTFTIAKSNNAYLKSLLLDGIEIDGFAADKFNYQDTVPYGATMPIVTWVVGDEQQQVDTTWNGDTQLTLTVTAGDGMEVEEYTIVFVHLLSSNSQLIDLQINGVTVDGFSPDTIEYTITYPIGTDPSELFDATAITAVPEDPNATYNVVMDGTTAQIFVTAADGTMSVYVIHQEILLSNEAHLRMIWLDGTEVRGYNMDTLVYTIQLVPGAVLPSITAEPLDTLATWELGMETEVENGKDVEVFCTAQDGTTMVYVLQFRYANWNASAETDTDDYLFFYAGDGQYKAVTISIGVQIGIYDVNGRLLKIETLPTAHPEDVVVEIDEDGNQKLVSALPSAAGVYFAPPTNQVLFYVFFDSKTKKVAKGGKFQLAR